MGKNRKLFICPECHEDLGEPIDVDLYRIGWHCSKCKVKVYKEID